MEHPCISCGKEVRPRQHAVACDVCSNWQHRTCNTGINQDDYRSAVRGNRKLSFVCRDCSLIGQAENADLNHIHTINGYSSGEFNLATKPKTTQGFDDNSSDEFDVTTRSKPQCGFSDVKSDVLEDLKSKPKPVYRFTDSSDDESEDFTPARYDRLYHLDTDLINEEKVQVTYTVLKNGSQRGKDLLTDSRGYTYCVKRRSKHSTFWRCSKRSKNWQCGVAVTQKGACFTARHGYHNHLPYLHRAGDAQLKVKINENLPASTGQTARSIILESRKELNGSCDTSPLSEDHMLKLIRATNRAQAKLRQVRCRKPAVDSDGNRDTKNPSIQTLPMYSSAKRDEENKAQSNQQPKASTYTPNELSKDFWRPIQGSQSVLNKTFTINPEDKQESWLPTRFSNNVEFNTPTLVENPSIQAAPTKENVSHPGYPCTARSIVENVLLEMYGDLKAVDPSLNINNLIRTVNRQRAKIRKEHLKELARKSGTGGDVIGLPSTGSGKPRPLEPPKGIHVKVGHDLLQGKDEGRPI